MRQFVRVPGLLLHLASIHCASMLLPRIDREEWRKEWASELWYVYHDLVLHPLSWRGHLAVLDFCKGAFHDAHSLRQSTRPTESSHVPHAKSAIRCLGTFAALAFLGAAFALFLPGVRTLFEPSPYRDPGHLMVIAQQGTAAASNPTIPVEQYRSWRTRSQRLFTEFALYQPTAKSITIAPHQSFALSVASASPNLFPLLGISLPPQKHAADSLPSLYLADSAWRTIFKRDATLLGKTVRVGDREVKVAGILKDDAWQLPGKTQAWIIEQQGSVPALAADSMAFVIARLAPAREAEIGSHPWHMLIPSRGAFPEDKLFNTDFDCSPLGAHHRRPLDTYIFTILLALLALPATTSLPLGDYPQNDHRLPWRLGMRRWAFLSAKLILGLPIVFFFSLDLAQFFAPNDVDSALLLQIVSTFSITLFGLRWILRDQRRRCPVCLCRLTHPARVGEASRSFLAWNATELICADGHGLLHVPELPTCWFPTQRWLYLDASWSSLFITSA